MRFIQTARITPLLACLMVMAPLAVRAAEEPVDPYVQSPANAGAKPFRDDGVYQAFHEKAGIDRIVATMIKLSVDDPRIGDIFKGQDLERLQRTLSEQICYLSGGTCDYTGRDMKTAHKDLGIQQTDMGILVEHLQTAMDAEKVSFRAQNQLLSKLAPMRPDIVVR